VEDLGLGCDATPRVVDACADFGRIEKPAPSSDNLVFTCACDLTLSRRGSVVGELPYMPSGGPSAIAPGNEGRLRSRIKSAGEAEPSEAPAVVGRAGDLNGLGDSKSLGDTAGRRWGRE